MLRAAAVSLLGAAAMLLPMHSSAADFHEIYGGLLAAHTRAVADAAGTRVDYAALGRDPAWKELLARLDASAPPASTAPQSERFAFFINAYNVLAMDVVVQNQPLASIRDAGSLLRPVWKRPAGRIGGRAYTLDEIEHEILRPIGDPRVHVAIVCASTSCPSLAREPFDVAQLDRQLDAAAARLVADRAKGVRVEAQGVRLSAIFEWFAADFEPSGGVLAFVRRYATPELRTSLDRLGADPKLSYFDYDWSLNQIRAQDDGA